MSPSVLSSCIFHDEKVGQKGEILFFAVTFQKGQNLVPSAFSPQLQISNYSNSDVCAKVISHISPYMHEQKSDIYGKAY